MEDMHRIMAFLDKTGSYEKTSQADIKEAVLRRQSLTVFGLPPITAGKRVCCGEKLGFLKLMRMGKERRFQNSMELSCIIRQRWE